MKKKSPFSAVIKIGSALKSLGWTAESLGLKRHFHHQDRRGLDLCGQEAVYVGSSIAQRSWTIRADRTRSSQVALNQATEYLLTLNPKGEILWLADGSLHTVRPFTCLDKLSGPSRRRRGSRSGRVSVEDLERQLPAGAARGWSADTKSYISIRRHEAEGWKWSWAPRIQWAEGAGFELFFFVLLDGTRRPAHRSLEKSGVFRKLRRSLHPLGFRTTDPQWVGRAGSEGASRVFVERLGLSAAAALALARRLEAWSPGSSL